jgi:glutathione S-transferase/RNA polymerase-associated protein
MILIDHPVSPYAQKVRMVLFEKQIDFESREMWSKSQREELFSLNPRGEVPALIDGETIVTDSTIICEYLEERTPEPPLLPADPAARANARIVERLADTSIDGCVLPIAIFKMFRPKLGTERPDALELAESNLRGHYAHLEGRLDGKEYFAGEFSRADLAMITLLNAATSLGYPFGDDQPRLASWLERMNARPSVVRSTADLVNGIEKASTIEDPLFDDGRLHWRDSRIEWMLRCGLGDWLASELAADRAFFSPIPS